MPKKARSARRQTTAIKSSARRRKNGLDDEDDLEGGVVDVDMLSENYTIAESMCSSMFDNQSLGSFYETDEDDDGEEHKVNHSSIRSLEAQSRKDDSATNRQTKLLDSLSHASTIITERNRASKREQNLRNLFRAITQYATGPPGRETIVSRLDDIILPVCTNGLRAGIASPAEQYASCRVLEATAILLGGNMDEYCEEIYEPLCKVVRATGRSTRVRGAALRALATSHLICASVFSTTEAVLDLCEKVCMDRYRGEEVAPSLRATALDCWALLSTTVQDGFIAGEDEDGSRGRGVGLLPVLAECLNHGNLDLRCAAGECTALIHEARLNLGIDDDDGANASERRFHPGSWEGSESEVTIDEMKQRIAELSVESGHHLSKKSKKEQRASFREFMATVVEDESPSEIVTFRGGHLTLNSWKEIIQLNFIRHCLQGGFQIQLMTNDTLQMIFGANGRELNASGAMSYLEKRLIMSKTSDAAKAADQEMRKKRKSRINAQNRFLTADGDDPL